VFPLQPGIDKEYGHEKESKKEPQHVFSSIYTVYLAGYKEYYEGEYQTYGNWQ